METKYDEQLILDSGQNVRLSSGMHLVDILRIEYYQELSFSLAFYYLQHISGNSNYMVYLNTPCPVPDYCIILMPDWSVLIKSKTSYKSIKITPISSFIPIHKNCIHLYLNSTFLTSYKITGLVSLFFSVKNPIVFLELYKKLNFSQLAQKSLTDIKNFILVSSKIPYKTLHLNIQEAKETINSNSSYKKEIKPVIKPFILIEIIHPRAVKKIDMDLYEIGEHSESLEYSPTQDINSRRNSLKKSPKFTLPDIAEEPTHKKSLSEIAEIIGNGKLFKTPLNSPRQVRYSISEIKQIMKADACEGFVNGESAKNYCSCSFCDIY